MPDPWERTASHLAGWIAAEVQAAGLQGTVVGISGGIDSAVVAALCLRAVGDRAYGLILPCHSAGADLADATEVARWLGIRTCSVDLGPAYECLWRSLATVDGAGGGGPNVPDPDAGGPGDLAAANLKPRLRMAALYYLANRRQLMVVGTSNRAEAYVGYATKHGDAGVDLQPLANLLKREVRALAAHLGVPERIIERPPSAGLWPGQTDEGEMGLTYAELDHYLATGEAHPAVRERIERLHRGSAHKRCLPPVPPPVPTAGR